MNNESYINYFYLDFNVTGTERQRLVKAISDFTGADARYLGAPNLAYEVDYFTVGRNGVVSFDDRADSEEIEALLEILADKGFVSQVSNLGREAGPSEDRKVTQHSNIEERGIYVNAYFKELTRRLNRAGIQTAPPEKDRLPILWNGEAVFFCSPTAHLWIQTEAPLDAEAKEAYYKAADIAMEVREYVSAVEQAPQLTATSLSDEFRRLADFNDVVLAGRELPNGYGYQFVTWGWNREQNGLYHGHYYEDDYRKAKEDFATRSGLVQKDRLFSDEQLAEVFRAVAETLDSGHILTAQREKLLESALDQIKDTVPDLQDRVTRSNEAEYAESLRFRARPGEVPSEVDIYWQDLTPEKQAEILRAFGDNGNWDVIPITTLGPYDAPEDSMSQEQDGAGPMEMGGM